MFGKFVQSFDWGPFLFGKLFCHLLGASHRCHNVRGNRYHNDCHLHRNTPTHNWKRFSILRYRFLNNMEMTVELFGKNKVSKRNLPDATCEINSEIIIEMNAAQSCRWANIFIKKWTFKRKQKILTVSFPGKNSFIEFRNGLLILFSILQKNQFKFKQINSRRCTLHNAHSK